jgi:hypothetical protein
MTYELAKELKEAGFPYKHGGAVVHTAACERRETFMCDAIYAPSIEEPIDACGEQFRIMGKSLEWYANGFKHPDNYTAGGSTSAEAVARLWLTLNKKA